MAKVLKNTQNVQKNNEIVKDKKRTKLLSHIVQEKKDEITVDLLENSRSLEEKEQETKVQSVIDKYFSSVSHFYFDLHQYYELENILWELQWKLNEHVIKENFNIDTVDIDQLKQWNNIYFMPPHGFWCPACWWLAKNIMFVEIAVKNNNMVILPNRRNITYVTSDWVISYIDGKIYSWSYEKLWLLALLFIDWFRNSDLRDENEKQHPHWEGQEYIEKNLKQYTWSSSLWTLFYDKIKSKLVNDYNDLGERGGDGPDGKMLTNEQLILRFKESSFAKWFWLSEDDIRNVRYTNK